MLDIWRNVLESSFFFFFWLRTKTKYIECKYSFFVVFVVFFF